MKALRNMRIKRTIIYITAIAATLLLVGITWFSPEITDQNLKLIITGVLLVVCSCVLIMDCLHLSYIDKLLAELSNLISTLIDYEGAGIFPESEDTLLSKLQSQLIKLSTILKAQSDKAAAERHEIQSLISDIVHQMKTPVATIKTFGELLLEENISTQERSEYLDALITALDKLSFLTESMIKMSRLESGIIRLKPQKTEVNDIILRAIKQVYKKADENKIELIYEPVPRVYVTADPNWTCEALFNILDNAVKYTPGGGKVTIELKKYEVYTSISITDTGIGIPETEAGTIFKRFYRGTAASSYEGIGIGLYLARQIITGQSGYIKVYSDGQSGSTFTVYLLSFI